jgi:hypothetical protein
MKEVFTQHRRIPVKNAPIKNAHMKKTLLALSLGVPLGIACAFALPTEADARTIRVTTTLKRYGGNGAYLAIYIVDANGKLFKTVRLAGGKAKYHRHLGGWYRASRGRIDGATGASVGAGETLLVSVDLADALIDAGYQIRVDSAVENIGEAPADAAVPLNAASAGRAVPGRGFVSALRFDM